MPRRCGGQSVSCRWAGDMFAEARVPTCARRRWRAGPTDKCACVRRMRAAAVRRHAACQLSSPTRDRETITGRPSVKLKCSQGRYRRQQTAATASSAAAAAAAAVCCRLYLPCEHFSFCLLYTSPSPRDRTRSRMPSSA